MATERINSKVYYRHECEPRRYVLMSIKPIYCNRIIAGDKIFEYRKSIFKDFPKRIYIYSSYPQSRIIASFEPQYIFVSTPDLVWAITSLFGGITVESFADYFSGKDAAFAIRIGNVHEFTRPVSLSDLDPKIKAPQNFCYLNEQQVSQIEKLSKWF